jgi:N6-adenosine-specific RNA methylase IME4
MWFPPGTPVSFTNETDCHDITEILLKVALNTIKPNLPIITQWANQGFLVIGTGCTGSWKFNYHTIMAMTTSRLVGDGIHILDLLH